MPTLAEQIRADLTAAMRSQEKERLPTLRLLQAALKNEQIHLGHELSDEEALAVIRKGVKQRKDSIEQYEKGNRAELAEKERAEMHILAAYLPPELTDAELEATLRDIITATGAQSKKDMGKVMKEATAQLRGRADGRKIQEVAGRLLD